jgi:hypothetical protein
MTKWHRTGFGIVRTIQQFDAKETAGPTERLWLGECVAQAFRVGSSGPAF